MNNIISYVPDIKYLINNNDIDIDRLSSTLDTMVEISIMHKNLIEKAYSEFISMDELELQAMCKYYGIECEDLCKDDMIQSIILFEIESKNEIIVESRKTAWRHISALKEDKKLNRCFK